MLALDANRMVVAYSYPDSSPAGYMQVITVNPSKNLTGGPLATVTPDNGQYISMAKLNDNTVVVTYRGESEMGFIRTFDISNNSTITAGTAYPIEDARTAYTSLVRVDDDTVAVAYSVIGDDTPTPDRHGRIKVFDVDALNDDIPGVGGLTYYNAAADAAFEEQVHLNSLALLDSDTLAIAYRGASGDGFVRLYDIDHMTGSLTITGEPFEHDQADGAFNSLVRVDENTLALVYGGDLPSVIQDSTATSSRIKTLSVVLQDTVPPTIESAVTTDANTIVLTASEPLAGTADATDFAVSGSNAIAGNPVISGSSITLRVGTAIVPDDVFTVEYSGTPITDAAGNILVTFDPMSVTNNVGAAIHTISQTHPVDLPNNGYRHNLIHLAGNYYVSSHTVTTHDVDVSVDFNAITTLRLYSITSENIRLIGSEIVRINNQPVNTPIHEFDTHPTSTAITRVDDDTIAISYVGATRTSNVRTYDVDTGSDSSPFTHSSLVSFLSDDDGSQTHNHSLITLDANRLVLAYSYPDSSPAGYIRIITVDPDSGVLRAQPSTTITADQGQYPSLVRLDDDTVVLAYRGVSEKGFIQTFDISDRSAITAGTALEHEPARTAYNSLIRVDDDTVAVAYSTIGDAASTSDGQGIIQVFDVDAMGVVTAEGDRTLYYGAAADAAFEEQVHLNSLVLLDSDTMAITYRGADGDGFIRLYGIDHMTGSLTTDGGPFEHDPAYGAFNSLVRVDDQTLAMVYGGDMPGAILDSTATPNRIKTIAATAPDTTPPVIITATDTPAISDGSDIQTLGAITASDSPVLTDTASLNIPITATDAPAISDESDIQTLGTLVQSDTPVITDSALLNIPITATDAPAISDEPDISDINAPTVVGVSATPNSYKKGDIIGITVTFDEPVTVSGGTTLQLLLDIGTTDNVAVYTPGAPGTELTFTYTVAATHNTDALNYVDTNSLSVTGGGTVTNTAGNATAYLRLPATTDAASLGGSDVIVDTVAPTVTIVNDQTAADGDTSTTRTLTYTATFSEPVEYFDAITDITVSGAATAADAAPAGSGDTYTFTVTAPADGTVVVSIPADAASDAADNGNVASAPYNVTLDIAVPIAVFVNSLGSSSPSKDNGQFDTPYGVAVNSAQISVVEFGNSRVQTFDLDGNYVSKFGSQGSGNNQFQSPRGIATTSMHILVSDTLNDRVQVFNLDGSYLSQFGGSGITDGKFKRPRGITANSTHVLVTDSIIARIQVFDTDNVYSQQVWPFRLR